MIIDLEEASVIAYSKARLLKRTNVFCLNGISCKGSGLGAPVETCLYSLSVGEVALHPTTYIIVNLMPVSSSPNVESARRSMEACP